MHGHSGLAGLRAKRQRDTLLLLCVSVCVCVWCVCLQVSYVEDYDGDVCDAMIGGWEGVGQEVWSLAERCIHEDRNERPCAAEVSGLSNVYSVMCDVVCCGSEWTEQCM